jgi:acetylornithine deacetylase
VIDPDFKADVKHIFSRLPLQSNESEEIVQLTRDIASRVTNKIPNTVGAAFWTDAALLANAGVSSFLFGPHGEGAHAAIEWVDLDTVEQCVEIYTSVAAEFCK